MSLTGHPQLRVFMFLKFPVPLEGLGNRALLLRRLPSGLVSLIARFISLVFGVHTWNPSTCRILHST